MSERLFVYNPADGDFDRGSFTYNAHEFVLKPNAVNEIVSPWPEISAETLLAACLQQLAAFGVLKVDVTDGVDLDAYARAVLDDEIISDVQVRSEAIHEAWLRKVHGKTLADFKRDNDRLEECGLTPVKLVEAPKKVQVAVAKLKEWGVIVGLLLVALLFTGQAGASETARHNVLSRMFTSNDYFGFPPSAGAPFTCNGTVERSKYYDTTAHVPYVCDGTSWVSMVSPSTFSGDYLATGKWTFGSAADAANSVRLGETAGCVVYEGSSADASETSVCTTNATADTTINWPALSAGTYTAATSGHKLDLFAATTTAELMGVISNEMPGSGVLIRSVVASTGSGTPTYFEVPALTLVTGISNSCLGNGTCAALSSGARNTVYGHASGTTMTTVNDNTIIGDGSGTGSALGPRNTFIGSSVGPNVNNTVTQDNTAVGYNACGNLTGGSTNTCVGASSGLSISTSTGQVMLGYNTQGGGGLNYSIALGSGGNINASNQMGVGGNGQEINDIYWGEGANPNASPITSVTHQPSPASGTDTAGTSLITAGGRATGTGAGGDRVEKTSPALTTGTTLQTLETRELIRAKQFTLADNTATTFAVQTLGNDTGGGGTIHYCVYAADATTAGLECGDVDFAGVDVTSGAGGEVCTTPVKHGTPIQALSGSTLAVTFAATTGTDLCNLRVTADTDIATPVALWIKYHVINSGRAITPQ